MIPLAVAFSAATNSYMSIQLLPSDFSRTTGILMYLSCFA
ncbi:hypothetical protein EVA_16431 [gut metagenome]|uniref:Uncharacterized protein n=1 Tax=gut metagenome TaxID=749906 RepID=J9G7L8_9ZZZZ